MAYFRFIRANWCFLCGFPAIITSAYGQLIFISLCKARLRPLWPVDGQWGGITTRSDQPYGDHDVWAGVLI